MNLKRFFTIAAFFAAITMSERLSAQGTEEEINQVQKALDQKDYTSAYPILKKLADAGNPEAQCNLARLLLDGHGAKQNNSEAIRLLRLAVKQKNSYAQFMLGAMFYNGVAPISQSYKEAARLFSLAADQNNSQAQVMLGRMYAMRRGVEYDSKKAGELYRKAADQGDATGEFLLADLDPSDLEEPEKIDLYKKAARQGEKNAQSRLKDRGLNW